MTRREAERLTRQADTLRALGFTVEQAEQLRRISLSLHRWAEHECNGVIQRDGDDGDGRPFWYSSHTCRKIGPAVDRERGALKRLQAIIDARNERAGAANGFDRSDAGVLKTTVTYYVQGDPRGAALYILRPGDVPEGGRVDGYYSRGIAVY